jgi:predicted deacylase
MTIGHSVQGRPLEVWRFGRGPNQYLVIAGIHGGYELVTIELADELINYFSRKPDAVPTDATLYILRSMNPDGEALPDSKLGRANANGVDLNRSFPVEWQPDWDRDGCWDLMLLSAGEYPGSEPEAIAVMAFLLEHKITAVVSYHAAAPGFYPAGDPPDPDSVALSEYLSVASGYPYPAYYTGCYMTGSLVDWALTTGAAAVDVELATHWETEFPINLNLVLALLRWKP